MNRSFVFQIALSIAIILLLSNSVVISKDSQDSWILEGLEITFVLFVIVYGVTFFSEKKVSRMIVLAMAGRIVFLLIPNLKYDWFQGIWIDQHSQYALANHVLNEGQIANPGPFTVSVYNTTPFIHLTFAILSIILNIPIMYSVKYLPVIMSPIYPLLTFIILKKLKFPWGTTVFKYALFISSVPVIPYYVVSGSSFGSLLVFLTLATLIISSHRNERPYRFVFIFLVCALVASHSSSSVLLSIFLLITILIQKVSYFRLKPYVKLSTVLATVSISAAWLMFQASYTMQRMISVFSSGLSGGTTPGSEQVPVRYFELARANMLDAVRLVLPYYGADFFLLLLSFVGLLILLKIRKQLNDTAKYIIVLTVVVFLFSSGGLLVRVAGFRGLHFARLLFPIFSAIFVLHLRKAWMRAIVLLLIVFLATLQFYNCQPLIPSAKVLFADLPESEPIVYVNLVNTVYQRQMIDFARDHVTGQIANDIVTGNQLVGLTDLDFVVEHIGWSYYYPLDKSRLEREYDCFLIHLPGLSGGFGEKVEMRTRQVILQAIYNSSVVYTNAESYVLIDS